MTNKNDFIHNASPSVFGDQFQTFVGIILTLHTIHKMEDTDFVNIEGPKQDIELKINRCMLYCQAKSATDPDVDDSNKTNWGEKLKKGVGLLFKDFYCNKKRYTGYIYAINYPYPLGVGKYGKCKVNFGTKNYGNDISCRDLKSYQKRIIINHVKKYDWVSNKLHNDAKFNKDFIKLIKKFMSNLIFVCYDFRRYHSAFASIPSLNNINVNRKYRYLYYSTKSFLQNNKLFPDIQPPSLANYWMNMFHDNASEGPNYKITRKQFCISIYVNALGSKVLDAIGNKTIHSNIRNEIISRYQDLIEINDYSLSFAKPLSKDIDDYFGKDYDSILGDNNIDKFITKYEPKYDHYFAVSTLTKKQRKMLTEYALEDFLVKRKSMHNLIYGDIQNAN